jgi:hypothetical protein
VRCDFPEHHRGGGFDWWLLLALAAAAAVFAGLWLLWEALGRPVAVFTGLAGLVLAVVLVGVARAFWGAVRATPRRGQPLTVETPIADEFGEAYYVPGMIVSETEGPVDVVDELAARRARRVA